MNRVYCYFSDPTLQTKGLQWQNEGFLENLLHSTQGTPHNALQKWEGGRKRGKCSLVCLLRVIESDHFRSSMKNITASECSVDTLSDSFSRKLCETLLKQWRVHRGPCHTSMQLSFPIDHQRAGGGGHYPQWLEKWGTKETIIRTLMLFSIPSHCVESPTHSCNQKKYSTGPDYIFFRCYWGKKINLINEIMGTAWSGKTQVFHDKHCILEFDNDSPFKNSVMKNRITGCKVLPWSTL